MSNTLTKTELEIMQYLWNINKEVTAGDIRAHFSHKNWSKQAVSTFLKCLVNSGYLKVRKESFSKYYYSVAITEEEHNISPAKEIIDKFFSGSLKNFVCALAKPYNLSAEEVQEINQLITRLDNEKE